MLGLIPHSTQTQAVARTLEIKDPILLRDISISQQIANNFGIFHWKGKPVLLEYRSYSAESPVPVELDSRTRDLVDKLANLLSQPKEIVFRTPSCQGWVRQMQHNRVAYMFSVPDAVEPNPVSLLQVLASDNSSPPSLSQRLWLATKLARGISQLQLVKWVHESFRSENVLFFPNPDVQGTKSPPECRIDLCEPWILGFEFSRPETFFSHGHADVCLSRDIYRHPDRQQNPTQLFNKLHDIYALGVVLLEIGLWQPALTLDKSGFAKMQDPQVIKKYLVRHAKKRLGSKVGEKYQGVVLKCLEGNFDIDNDTKEDLKLQQSFRAQVVDVLQRAAENI